MSNPISLNMWTRLEGRSRHEDIHEGLQARIQDPLWLLARQWQMGEFLGEDAGTPIVARVRPRTATLTHFAPDVEGEAFKYDLDAPLETLVEGEPSPDNHSVRFAAEAGLHLLYLMEEEGVSLEARRVYVRQFPLRLDEGERDEQEHDEQKPPHTPVDRRFLRVMARRAPDARPLLELFASLRETMIAEARADLDATLRRGLRRAELSLYNLLEPERDVSLETVFVAGLVPETPDSDVSRRRLRELSASDRALGDILEAGLDALDRDPAEVATREEVEEHLVRFVLAWLNSEGLSVEDVWSSAAGRARTGTVLVIGAEERRRRLPRWLDAQQHPQRLRPFLLRGANQLGLSPAEARAFTQNLRGLGKVFLAALKAIGTEVPEQQVTIAEVVSAGAPALNLTLDVLLSLEGLNDQLQDWLWEAFPIDAIPGMDLIDHDEYPAIRQTAARWLESYRISQTAIPSSSSWDPQRLEYNFSVLAPAGPNHVHRLQAKEYHGGHLDWYHFSANGTEPLDSVSQPTELEEETLIPTRVTFRGAPAARWWQFEDGSVNLDTVTAPPTDLALALMTDYRLIFGNDWFILPLDLPIGSLSQLDEVTVSNTFAPLDEPLALSPVNSTDWRLFHLSGPDSNTGMLFLPPVLASSQHSRVLERVRFARDEVANLGWAIEQVIESVTGTPINRREMYDRRELSDTADTSSKLRYLLRSDTPDYWFPLVPELEDRKLWFVLRRLQQLQTGKKQSPFGRILEELHELTDAGRGVRDEEVPRSGVFVTRRRQYARWQDGSTHLWMARRKWFGGRELSSGLRWDTTVATENSGTV